MSIQKGEASLNMKVEEKKVKIELKYDGTQADAAVMVELEVEQYLEMLKAAIPGTVDDMVIDGLKAMLLK